MKYTPVPVQAARQIAEMYQKQVAARAGEITMKALGGDLDRENMYQDFRKELREDIDKQEELVSALWEFAHGLQNNECNTWSVSDGTRMHLPTIKKAMERIMKNFGFKVIPIE